MFAFAKFFCRHEDVVRKLMRRLSFGVDAQCRLRLRQFLTWAVVSESRANS